MVPFSEVGTVVKRNVIPTADYTWTYKYRTGDDKVESRLRYKDDFDGWDRRVPAEGSEHPDIRGMYLVEIKAAKEEGGLIAVDLSYESSSWTADYPGKRKRDKSQERFQIEPSLSDEPVLSSPKAALLTEAEKNALSEYQGSDRGSEAYGKAAGAIESEEGLSLLNVIRKGQEAWRAPQVVWVRRRTIKSISEIPFEKIGKIDDPPKDKDGQPSTPDGYNWMYLAPEVEDSPDGLTYGLVERWERSNEGGWEEFFYALDEGGGA